MPRSRPGFTLVELLVVIAIIGILMGLAIPAVQSARETARRNQCSTNVKSLAMAAVLHEGSKKRFPGWIEKFGEFAPSTVDPSDPDRTGGTIPRHVKVGTWAVALLPHLEAQPTYEHWTEDRYPIWSDGTGLENTFGISGEGFHSLAAPNLAVFQCPSDPVTYGDYGKNSYIANNGGRAVDGSIFPPANRLLTFPQSQDKANGVFNAQYIGAAEGVVDAYGNPNLEQYTVGPKVSLDDLKDGLANTALFSENVQAYPWHRAGFINAADLVIANPGDEMMGYEPNARFIHGMVWHYEDTSPTSAAMWSSGTPAPVYSSHKINGIVTGRNASLPSGEDDVSFDIYNVAMDDMLERGISNPLRTDPFQPYRDPNSIPLDPSDIARPSSAHTAGVNVGFADGSVRFINETIDYRVYQAMLTPRGKSSEVPWPEFIVTDELQ